MLRLSVGRLTRGMAGRGVARVPGVPGVGGRYTVTLSWGVAGARVLARVTAVVIMLLLLLVVLVLPGMMMMLLVLLMLLMLVVVTLVVGGGGAGGCVAGGSVGGVHLV